MTAPVEELYVAHAGTSWLTLKKKHRRRSDAAAYSKAFIKRYRRLLEALDESH